MALRRGAGRGLLPLLLLCTPLLSGYVLPPAKALQRWCRDGVRPAAVLPALVPVRQAARDGQLYLAPDGEHALHLDGATHAAPLGAAARVALDLLLAPDPEAAAAVLEAVGVDLTQAGYARHACSADGVAHTLGARGEGDPLSPQVWFARSPLRPCRVWVGGGEVALGPPGPAGWPLWLQLDDGPPLEFAGDPVPAPVRPAWATPAPGPVDLLGPDPVGEWRRAFDPDGR